MSSTFLCEIVSMSNQQAHTGEEEPGTSQQDAYFDEVSGLRESYDSHILPADYKYKVGMYSSLMLIY